MTVSGFRITIGQMMFVVLLCALVLATVERLPGASLIAIFMGYVFAPILVLFLVKRRRLRAPFSGRVYLISAFMPEVIVAVCVSLGSAISEWMRIAKGSAVDITIVRVAMYAIGLLAFLSIPLSFISLLRFFLIFLAKNLIDSTPPRCPVCGIGRLRREFRLDRLTRLWVLSEFSRCRRCESRGRYAEGDEGPTWEPTERELEIVITDEEAGRRSEA